MQAAAVQPLNFPAVGVSLLPEKAAPLKHQTSLSGPIDLISQTYNGTFLNNTLYAAAAVKVLGMSSHVTA